MSVKSEWNMRCPKCKSDEGINIEATMQVRGRLTEDGFDYDGGDTEWNDDSAAECSDCGFEGKVKDFELPKRKRA